MQEYVFSFNTSFAISVAFWVLKYSLFSRELFAAHFCSSWKVLELAQPASITTAPKAAIKRAFILLAPGLNLHFQPTSQLLLVIVVQPVPPESKSVWRDYKPHGGGRKIKKFDDFFRLDWLSARAILLDIEVSEASGLFGRAICCARRPVRPVM